ncbi:class I SAM-dependent methyltransferase [Gynuella sunshinyii]|uniref:class I SAM-dependent methyltransferase n=1 Tax=Gynuella sunshinyii TaxID=1445505 RepID=UPI0005CBA2CD|nr:class I SAM-dependent methyltransferase [Gynuella sunshinyii]
MKPNYLVHDEIYVQVKNAGLAGWGGNERISHDSEFIERVFAIEDVPSKGKLLELGCGEGHLSRCFARLGYEVTGVDISSAAVNWAKEKSKSLNIPGHFYVADLTKPAIDFLETYDVIVDGNCLHCIIGDDRRTFLNLVFQSLLKNGVFFVSSLCSKDDHNAQIIKDGFAYRHISSVNNLISELEGIGFHILKTNIYEREKYNHITVHVKK